MVSRVGHSGGDDLAAKQIKRSRKEKRVRRKVVSGGRVVGQADERSTQEGIKKV